MNVVKTVAFETVCAAGLLMAVTVLLLIVAGEAAFGCYRKGYGFFDRELL